MFGLFGPPNIQKLEAKQDVAGLIKALSYEKDPFIRAAAAKALGNVGDDSAVEPLIAALTDRGFNSVRNKDDHFMAGDDNIKRTDRHNIVCWEAAAALDRMAPNWSSSAAARAAVPAFLAILKDRLHIFTKDRDYGVRRVAVQSLGKIKDPRALDALIAALRDTESDLRYDAVESLGMLKDPRAIAPLLETLMHGDYTVCKAAFRILSIIDPNWNTSDAAKSAVPKFTAALKDNDTCIKWAAEETLKQMAIS